MVTFPSLLKIRKSEIKVAFLSTTRGFLVVPSRYSRTLHGKKKKKKNRLADTRTLGACIHSVVQRSRRVEQDEVVSRDAGDAGNHGGEVVASNAAVAGLESVQFDY